MYIDEHQDKYCTKNPELAERERIATIRAKMKYTQPWLENAKIKRFEPGKKIEEDDEEEDGFDND